MDVLRNGRTRRTASEWKAILGQFAESGLSAREFCRRESINLNSFIRWRKKLEAEQAAEARDDDRSRFVEVSSSEGFPAFWSVEIEHPDGRTLRIRG